MKTKHFLTAFVVTACMMAANSLLALIIMLIQYVLNFSDIGFFKAFFISSFLTIFALSTVQEFKTK